MAAACRFFTDVRRLKFCPPLTAVLVARSRNCAFHPEPLARLPCRHRANSGFHNGIERARAGFARALHLLCDVGVKKKSPRAIQYLLNVDQKLRKISLRRISERLQTRRTRVRSKTSSGTRNSMRVRWPMSSRAIALGIACVVAAAAMIAAAQSGPSPDVARETDVATQITPAAKSGRAPAVQTAAKPAAVVPAAQPAAVDSKAPAEAEDSAPVTITGCLERDGVTFWLKDTSGVPDAAKARSWKSGFLKKRSSRVGVVSATNAVRLPNYVGERVAATGAFMDGQMRARSMRRLAASCK